MKQTTSKQKNTVVNLPKTIYYTLDDVFAMNKGEKEITTRVRHKTLEEAGKVAYIGTLHGGKGRPKKVYALTPITQNMLNKAKQDNIVVEEAAEKLVNVVKVTTAQPQPATNLAASTQVSPLAPATTT